MFKNGKKRCKNGKKESVKKVNKKNDKFRLFLVFFEVF